MQPVVGRDFIEEDAIPNDPTALPGAPGTLPGMVVLSHSLWQQEYGGDASVIGQTIELSGASSQIVGVMPPGFELLVPTGAILSSNVDLWMASRIDYANAPRNNVSMMLVGRLRDGATAVQL